MIPLDINGFSASSWQGGFLIGGQTKSLSMLGNSTTNGCSANWIPFIAQYSYRGSAGENAVKVNERWFNHAYLQPTENWYTKSVKAAKYETPNSVKDTVISFIFVVLDLWTMNNLNEKGEVWLWMDLNLQLKHATLNFDINWLRTDHNLASFAKTTTNSIKTITCSSFFKGQGGTFSSYELITNTDTGIISENKLKYANSMNRGCTLNHVMPKGQLQVMAKLRDDTGSIQFVIVRNINWSDVTYWHTKFTSYTYDITLYEPAYSPSRLVQDFNTENPGDRNLEVFYLISEPLQKDGNSWVPINSLSRTMLYRVENGPVTSECNKVTGFVLDFTIAGNAMLSEYYAKFYAFEFDLEMMRAYLVINQVSSGLPSEHFAIGANNHAIISVELESKYECTGQQTFRVNSTGSTFTGIAWYKDDWTAGHSIVTQSNKPRQAKVWGLTCATQTAANECTVKGIGTYYGWPGDLVYLADTKMKFIPITGLNSEGISTYPTTGSSVATNSNQKSIIVATSRKNSLQASQIEAGNLYLSTRTAMVWSTKQETNNLFSTVVQMASSPLSVDVGYPHAPVQFEPSNYWYAGLHGKVNKIMQWPSTTNDANILLNDLAVLMSNPSSDWYGTDENFGKVHSAGGGQINKLPCFQFAMQIGNQITPAYYDASIGQWVFTANRLNQSAIMNTTVTSVKILASDQFGGPWNTLATYCVQSGLLWSQPDLSNCLGVSTESMQNQLHRNQNGSWYFIYNSQLTVTHDQQTQAPQRECNVNDDFTVPAQINVIKFVEQLPSKLSQSDIAVNSMWTNSVQAVRAVMIKPDGTFYKHVSFNNSFFEIGNAASELDALRNEETFQLLVYLKDCANFKHLTPSSSMASLTSTSNPVRAKIVPLILNFVSCRDEILPSVSNKTYFFQKNEVEGFNCVVIESSVSNLFDLSALKNSICKIKDWYLSSNSSDAKLPLESEEQVRTCQQSRTDPMAPLAVQPLSYTRGDLTLNLNVRVLLGGTYNESQARLNKYSASVKVVIGCYKVKKLMISAVTKPLSSHPDVSLLSLADNVFVLKMPMIVKQSPIVSGNLNLNELFLITSEYAGCGATNLSAYIDPERTMQAVVTNSAFYLVDNPSKLDEVSQELKPEVSYSFDQNTPSLTTLYFRAETDGSLGQQYRTHLDFALQFLIDKNSTNPYWENPVQTIHHIRADFMLDYTLAKGQDKQYVYESPKLVHPQNWTILYSYEWPSADVSKMLDLRWSLSTSTFKITIERELILQNSDFNIVFKFGDIQNGLIDEVVMHFQVECKRTGLECLHGSLNADKEGLKYNFSSKSTFKIEPQVYQSLFQNTNEEYPVSNYLLAESEKGAILTSLDGMITITAGEVTFDFQKLFAKSKNVQTVKFFIVALNEKLILKAFLPVVLTRMEAKQEKAAASSFSFQNVTSGGKKVELKPNSKPPKVELDDIDTYGQVTLSFSEQLLISDFKIQELNENLESIVRFKVIKSGDDSQQSGSLNSRRLQESSDDIKNISLTSLDSKGMVFKLEFTNPLKISSPSQDSPDILDVQFVNETVELNGVTKFSISKYFRSAKTGLEIETGNIKLSQILPGQVPASQQSLIKTTEQMIKSTMNSAMIGNMILQLMMAKSLEKLMGVMSQMQFIVYMDNIAINFPGNIQMLLNNIKYLMNLEIIPKEWIDSLIETLGIQVVEDISNEGLNKNSFFQNLGAFIFVFIVLIIVIILLGIFGCYIKFVSKDPKWTLMYKKIYNQVFYQSIMTACIQTYLTMTYSTVEQIQQQPNKGSIYAFVLFAGYVIGFPLFVLGWMFVHAKNVNGLLTLKESKHNTFRSRIALREFKWSLERFQPLWSGIRSTNSICKEKGKLHEFIHRPRMLYYFIYVFRRLIFVLILVFVENASIQVALKLIAQMGIVMYTLQVRPLNDVKLQKIEIFTESAIFLLDYHLLVLLTQPIVTTISFEERYFQAGWSFVAVLIVVVLVLVGYLGTQSYKDIRRTMRIKNLKKQSGPLIEQEYSSIKFRVQVMSKLKKFNFENKNRKSKFQVDLKQRILSPSKHFEDNQKKAYKLGKCLLQYQNRQQYNRIQRYMYFSKLYVVNEIDNHETIEEVQLQMEEESESSIDDEELLSPYSYGLGHQEQLKQMWKLMKTPMSKSRLQKMAHSAKKALRMKLSLSPTIEVHSVYSPRTPSSDMSMNSADSCQNMLNLKQFNEEVEIEHNLSRFNSPKNLKSMTPKMLSVQKQMQKKLIFKKNVDLLNPENKKLATIEENEPQENADNTPEVPRVKLTGISYLLDIPDFDTDREEGQSPNNNSKASNLNSADPFFENSFTIKVNSSSLKKPHKNKFKVLKLNSQDINLLSPLSITKKAGLNQQPSSSEPELSQSSIDEPTYAGEEDSKSKFSVNSVEKKDKKKHKKHKKRDKSSKKKHKKEKHKEVEGD